MLRLKGHHLPSADSVSLRCPQATAQMISKVILCSESLQLPVISVRLQRETLNLMNDFPFCNSTYYSLTAAWSSLKIQSIQCPRTAVSLQPNSRHVWIRKKKFNSMKQMEGCFCPYSVTHMAPGPLGPTTQVLGWKNLTTCKRVRKKDGGFRTHVETDVIQWNTQIWAIW